MTPEAASLVPVIGVDTTLEDRYRLQALVGRGGMADVYRAHDLVLERTVAIKVVRGADEESARRFSREVRTMAALSHPGIVQLFDAGAHEGGPYLVMELVEGADLPTVLADGPMDAALAAALGRQLARALAHAHAAGIVHRDVKPANVLVDREGRSRLSDFGIARLADTTRVTTPGMTTGTAAYLAPEQLGGDDVGSEADVYSLGLVLLEALTGRKEYTGTPIEAAMARLQRDPMVPDDLPAPWPPLLRAMTARSPEQRPDAAQVAARLGAPPHSEAGASAPGTRAEPTLVLPVTAEPAAEPVTEPAAEPVAEPAAVPARESATKAPGPGPRRRWFAGTVALLFLAVVLMLAMGNRGDPPVEPAAPQAEDGAVPAELDEALGRLEEAVRP